MSKNDRNAIAIVGIHTGIGKTIVSAVVAEALGADYWKPVQAGIEERDMLTVQRLLTNGAMRVHSEAVLLREPASPHAAAAAEGIEIDHTSFAWPATDKLLVVETAGGVLSPVSATHTVADMVAHYRLPVILVTQNYLGSISHTLTAIEALRSRGIEVCGLIVSGTRNKMTESFITQYGRMQVTAHVPALQAIDNDNVVACACGILKDLKALNYSAK